jgi:hypothetical protein
VESIQTLLDERLIKEQKESTREKIASPSCLGNCIRKLMLMERNFSYRPLRVETLRTFKAGYLFEDFVLNTLDKTGKLVERQLKVEYRGIKGTLDSVASLNGENVLFDVKSAKMSSFKYKQNEGPGEDYEYQLSFYHLALSKRMKLSNVARLFFVEKENLMIFECPVMCLDHYKKVDDKITLIDKARQNKELPAERDTSKKSYPCYSVNSKFKTCTRYCDYSQNCPKIVSEIKKWEEQGYEVK